MVNTVRKKKIVHIITSLRQGGAESLLVYFLRYADTTHFEHAVIYFYDGPCAPQIQALGIALHHLPKPKYGYTPLFFMRIFRVVRALQPDCLHTWLWMANMIGRFLKLLLGVPVINSFHNNVDQDGFVRACIDQLTYKAATALVAVGPGVASSLKHRQPRLRADKRLSIITNGIAADDILHRAQTVAATRESLGLGVEHCIIGSVGRFVPLKNYPLLLRAFAGVYGVRPEVRLVLVGSGPQEPELRFLVQELQIQDVVHFVGNTSALAYYPIFDLFVLSSFKEGISIALLEAMSCGLPCIITNHVPEHDVIAHEKNGLVVHPITVPAFAQTLHKVIDDKELRKNLGAQAFASVRSTFSIAIMINGYYALYENVLRNRHAQ